MKSFHFLEENWLVFTSDLQMDIYLAITSVIPDLISGGC